MVNVRGYYVVCMFLPLFLVFCIFVSFFVVQMYFVDVHGGCVATVRWLNPIFLRYVFTFSFPGRRPVEQISILYVRPSVCPLFTLLNKYHLDIAKLEYVPFLNCRSTISKMAAMTSSIKRKLPKNINFPKTGLTKLAI